MQLKRTKLESRREASLKDYAKYKLPIIDEIGYLPISQEDSNLFLQLIDMRYEKKRVQYLQKQFDKHSNKEFYKNIYKENQRR